VAEQRYQTVLAVISDGLSISQVAGKVGVSRQTVHAWLARYEAQGLEGLVDRSHRPASCPHQMPAAVEGRVGGVAPSRPYWGPRRLVFELNKRGVGPVPSESAAYRALVRAGLIDPSLRDRRSRKWKRWERGVAMERLHPSTGWRSGEQPARAAGPGEASGGGEQCGEVVWATVKLGVSHDPVGGPFGRGKPKYRRLSLAEASTKCACSRPD
jgi:transposase